MLGGINTWSNSADYGMAQSNAILHGQSNGVARQWEVNGRSRETENDTIIITSTEKVKKQVE